MNRRIVSLVLSLIGVGGVGVTSWLAVRCSKKSEQETEKKKKILAYAPAIASGIGTAGCILGSHRVSSKEIAALTAGCTYLAANRDKIEKKVKEKFGKEKLQEIKKDIKPQELISQGQSIEWTGKGTVKFLDGYSGRLFYSSLEAVKKAERIFTERLQDGEYVSWNDFYSLLGIERTHFGHQFGYVPNEDYYERSLYEDNPIGFENVPGEDDDGKLMYVIEIEMYPVECWEDI